MSNSNDMYTIEVKRNGSLMLSVDFHHVPAGATFRECYETDDEIIVIGYPESDDEDHNCDQLGCSTVSHVRYRFSKAQAND